MTVNYCDCCGKKIDVWFHFNQPKFINNFGTIIVPTEERKRLIHEYQICEDCMRKINAIGMTNPNTTDISKELNKISSTTPIFTRTGRKEIKQ